MPIVGLTTRQTPRPAYIAKLRKGGPKQEKNGKEVFGRDLDHFRLDPTDPNDQTLVDALAAEYGSAPNYIEVYLPHATAEENFSAWMEEYNASQLIHRCDGETIHAYNHRGELVPTGEPCPYAAGKARTRKEPGCQRVGRLEVFIPALVQHAGRFGIVTVETHSIHDIVNLSSALAFYEQMSGDLRGKPFVISRVASEISTPNENGSRTRRTKHLLSLQPASEWVLRQLQAPEERRALAAPARQLVDHATGEIVDEEEEEAIEATARAVEVEPPTDKARRRFHALGKEVYGDEWDSKRPALVRYITRERTASSGDLSAEEMATLVRGMEAKRKEATPLAERFPASDAVASDGGGAPSTRCASCRVPTIAVDEAGLCSVCADRQRAASEVTRGRDRAPVGAAAVAEQPLF